MAQPRGVDTRSGGSGLIGTEIVMVAMSELATVAEAGESATSARHIAALVSERKSDCESPKERGIERSDSNERSFE